MIGTYQLANVGVSIDSLHEDVHRLCKDYRSGSPVELCVCTKQEDIDYEREQSEAADAAAGRSVRQFSDGYLETLAVYRKIAEAMPARDTILVHGSCVAVDGRAYLFCAPSGTGKSTHVSLWRELLGRRAVVVNDDKPLVYAGEGGATAFGTPWDGKHRLSVNAAFPLRAICMIDRANENSIERVQPAEIYPMFMQQVYRPCGSAALVHTLRLMDRLMSTVDFWWLHCNKDIEAARVSYAAMVGGELD